MRPGNTGHAVAFQSGRPHTQLISVRISLATRATDDQRTKNTALMWIDRIRDMALVRGLLNDEIVNVFTSLPVSQILRFLVDVVQHVKQVDAICLIFRVGHDERKLDSAVAAVAPGHVVGRQLEQLRAGIVQQRDQLVSLRHASRQRVGERNVAGIPLGQRGVQSQQIFLLRSGQLLNEVALLQWDQQRQIAICAMMEQTAAFLVADGVAVYGEAVSDLTLWLLRHKNLGATSAVHALGQAGCHARRRDGRVDHLIVTESLYGGLFHEHLVALCAMHALTQTALRAGRGNCFVNFYGVSQRCALQQLDVITVDFTVPVQIKLLPDLWLWGDLAVCVGIQKHDVSNGYAMVIVEITGQRVICRLVGQTLLCVC